MYNWYNVIKNLKFCIRSILEVKNIILFIISWFSVNDWYETPSKNNMLLIKFLLLVGKQKKSILLKEQLLKKIITFCKKKMKNKI